MTVLNRWTPEATTPTDARTSQPDLRTRPFRVRIDGHRAIRVQAKSKFAAAVVALNRKGLRYAETKFSVEEVDQ